MTETPHKYKILTRHIKWLQYGNKVLLQCAFNTQKNSISQFAIFLLKFIFRLSS